MTRANELIILQKDITNSVTEEVHQLQEDGLVLPKNYNYNNALRSAFFKISEAKDKNGRPALEVVTNESVIDALSEMITQGLSPAKNQCYFAVYGNKLVLMRSYFGTQAVLKRLSDVEDVWANVIYQDDIFESENRGGQDYLVKHETKFENRDKPIIGAYAIIKKIGGDEIMTVMTRKEIEAAWSQSKTGLAVHKKFPQEMAKKTVINRAAKNYINTSDDSDLLIESINRTTENEYDNDRDFELVEETPTSQNLLNGFKKIDGDEESEDEPSNKNDQGNDVNDVIEENDGQMGFDWYGMDAFGVQKDKSSRDDEELESSEKTTKEVDWDSYTVDQIKRSLDKHGIGYPQRALKAELIEIAEQFVAGGDENAYAK